MIKRKSLTKKQRLQVYEKTNGHCAYCGIPIEYGQMQVDHVTPFEFAHFVAAEGGDPNGMDNLLPACRPCNYIKSSLVLEKFRVMASNWPETLFRDSVTYRNAVRFGVVVPQHQRVTFYFEKIGLEVKDYMADFYGKLLTARERMESEAANES